jgi:ornithine cyclodeaminase/alanine dehydrogenase-like protein (mu-crystallin family)
MSLLILTQADVQALLPMDACIELMAGALAALARGQVVQPARTLLRAPGAAGLLLIMPAYVAGQGQGAAPFYGLKAVLVHDGNHARGLESHQGAVLLFDGETGQPLAVMNAAAITAIRTAAVSGLATRLLARPDAGDLAIIGAGVQARTHLAALRAVRTLRRVRVVSRQPEHARRFAAEEGAGLSFPVEAVTSVEAALRGADLIVTATTASAPVVQRAWIAAGAHLNAVGAYTPATRELDGETVAAARLFVDSRAAALVEAGDILLPMAAGAFGPEHIQAELGEVVIGAKPGRGSPDEITLFKSLGLPVEDAASADYVYRQAQARGMGTRVEF